MKTVNESAVLTAIDKMFQIVGAATLKARDAATVLTRFGSLQRVNTSLTIVEFLQVDN